MTTVDKPALFHLAGDTLSKTKLAKTDLSNSPLWHRWLQPLWAVKQTLPVVFDNAEAIHKLRTTKQDKAKRGRPRKNAPKPHQLNGEQ